MHQILTRLESLPTPAVITIDGRSGSGKTTLAHYLAQDRHATILEVELWSCGWQDLAGAIQRLAPVVKNLKTGPVHTHIWDWTRETWVETRIEPAELVIVVGCGANCLESDLAIRLYASESVRRARVTQRDHYDWSEHWQSWADQETALRDQCKQTIDFTVATEHQWVVTGSD